MLNLKPFIRELQLVDKDGIQRLFPIDEPFGWSQREIVEEVERQYNARKPVRVIILKPRQLGTSTIGEAVIYLWGFIHQNMNSLVIAHDARTSHALFEKARDFWRTSPWSTVFKPRRATLHQMAWDPPVGSAIQVATAGNLGSGRGQTFQAIHASECAQYMDASTLMSGLRNTMPNRHGSIEIVESTAFGVGNWFHSEWIAAEQGESSYAPLFFPFFKHPEYRAQTSLVTDAELDGEEKALRKLGASYEAIEWRRQKIFDAFSGDDDQFRQEYPSTSAEAFIASGTNVFKLDRLALCYAPPGERDYRTGQPVVATRGRLVYNGDDFYHPRFVVDKRGPLTVFKAPVAPEHRRDDRYFIGADPTRTSFGDPACAQVINRGTHEQVAVYHNRVDGIEFAKDLMALGYWYHAAEICPEVMGGGQQTIATLQLSFYPRVWQHRWADKAPGVLSHNTYGFAQNSDRKKWCIGRLQHETIMGTCTIHDELTYTQMVNYVHLTEFEMGPASKKLHDDAVVALGLAFYGSSTEPAFEEYPQGQDRRLQAVPDIYADRVGV